MQEAHGKTFLSNKLSPNFILLCVLLLAGSFKIALIIADVFPFNSDEAIVALMARHILQGRWQTFFYGQTYMGSLDASLVAAGFFLFGQKVVIIRVLQGILYLGTILSTFYIARLIFGSRRIGLLASIFMAIPTVNTTLYTTVSLGGYGEVLLLGNLLIICSLKVNSNSSFHWYAFWGILAGLGIWAFGLTLVYILPAAVLLIYHTVRRCTAARIAVPFLIVGICMAIGASPWLLWAFRNGLSPLFEELFGSAISGASSSNLLISILSHTYNLLLFGTTVIFGMRPPWAIRWLASPLLPIALAFWLLVVYHSIRRLTQGDDGLPGRWLLTGVALSLLFGFIFTPFGADPSGRYFLPLVVPMSVFAAEFVEDLRQRIPRANLVYLLPLTIVIFNFWGTVETAIDDPPGLTTQFDPISWIDHRFDRKLIQFLEEKGERRGYSNYWVVYPLSFLSEEQLIYVPRLPYHQDFRYTPRDNRYSPYNYEVEKSDRVAYITTNHPALDEYLRMRFEKLEVSWEEEWIGDYHVFYELSSVVRPDDLGLESINPSR